MGDRRYTEEEKGPKKRDHLYTLEDEEIFRKSYASKRQEDESKFMEDSDFHNSKPVSEPAKLFIPYEY